MRKRMVWAAMALLVFMLAGCGRSGDAKKSYNEGMKLFEQNQYEEAAGKLGEAVEKNPDKAEYYIAYGMALIEAGQFDDALIQFDKAVSEKENKIVRENNKRAFRGKGIAYYRQNDYKEAAKAFGEAAGIGELKGMDVDILYYKGEAEEKAGDYKSALETYSKLMDIKKPDGRIYGKKARMEYLLGDMEHAALDYDEAIRLDSDNYDAYFGKYFMLMDMSDSAGAEEVLNKALAIKTKTDEDYFNVARIHFFQGDYTSALAELTDSAAKGFTEALYYIGRIHESNGDYDQAVSCYERYLDAGTDTQDASVYNQLGMCHMIREDYDKALEAFEQGIALNDSGVLKELRSNQIAAFEKLADFKNAFAKAEEYMEVYPDDAAMKRELEFIRSRTGAAAEEAASKDKDKAAGGDSQDSEGDKNNQEAGGNSSASW